METRHLQPSGSTLTRKVSTESNEVYLYFIHYSLSSISTPQQIVSLLCLFVQGALPLDSSYSAHNVHNALGNCFFPLPSEISPLHKTKRLCPLVYFQRPQPGQIFPGQLEQASGLVCASKVPWKSVELT